MKLQHYQLTADEWVSAENYLLSGIFINQTIESVEMCTILVSTEFLNHSVMWVKKLLEDIPLPQLRKKSTICLNTLKAQWLDLA